jgi:uracil-DNA glycosylase family 4
MLFASIEQRRRFAALKVKCITREGLTRELTRCTRCGRLVRYIETVTPRRSFANAEYWRKPVPGFGDPDAWLMIVGLAPAAHGGNRTGRVFTGDESGRFLAKSLYLTGFANQPFSLQRDDGLLYTGCYVTAAVKCAPPSDRPTREEFVNCRGYLRKEIELLTRVTHVLALGQLAFRAYIETTRGNGAALRGLRFTHGASFVLGKRTLYASYHPSPRNTHTGRLTTQMLVSLLNRIKKDRERRV